MGLDFPVIFLLPTHLAPDQLTELEQQIPTLTYDINEAQVIVGKVSQKQRALFELRKYKLTTEELPAQDGRSESTSPRAKRRRTASPATVSTTYDTDSSEDGGSTVGHAQHSAPPDTITVAKLAWFTDSVKAAYVLPLDEKYVVYRGRKLSSPRSPAQPLPVMKPPPAPGSDIMKRALADASTSASHRPGSSRGHHGSHAHPRTSPDPSSQPGGRQRPALLHQSTSEEEINRQLPPIPAYLHSTYSCQRPTPPDPPNAAFIAQLTRIRTARTLTGDKVGVRAYSSAIATLAAYPHRLSSAHEVARLPGCGAKIALLFHEFRETGRLAEAEADDGDPKLAVLRTFYGIWGVAETTARDFYNRGWRDLDDVVEFGWDSALTRVQQIGVKFYDELQLGIPRDEVERIAAVVLEHANRVTLAEEAAGRMQGIGGGPGRCEMVIVGGYRRGKAESGDVDVVLSHRDERVTRNLIERLVVSLERDGYITHTLSLSTKNSERGQMPVSWKGSGGQNKAGAGFDTLDKALVVWQDPVWEAEDSGEEGKRKMGTSTTSTSTKNNKKNPNPHRRVDIIISPWKTVGCAVLGWTSGTTFQRDLRRYCKKERSLKFDSSGIRSRVDGEWVDLESGPDGAPAPDMLTAERRVFDGLGLEWRPPEERCTG